MSYMSSKQDEYWIYLAKWYYFIYIIPDPLFEQVYLWDHPVLEHQNLSKESLENV